MFEHETSVIIKGYCGYVEEYEITDGYAACICTPCCNITLRDARDPRIKIVMEGIRLDEIQQNPKP